MGKGKIFAVMFFRTETEMCVPNAKPNKWVNTHNKIFENGFDALQCYSNTRCPASQLIDAEDEYELQCKMGEMYLNFQDKEWLNKNLYPFL